MIGVDPPRVSDAAPRAVAVPARKAVRMPSRLAVRELTTTAEFDGLREEWNHVVSCLDVPSPLLSWEWSRLWWDYFGNGGSLRILVFTDRGETVGIAPFYVRVHGRGPLRITSLARIGWEDGGNQPMTEQLDLLFPPARKRELWEALGAWLRRSHWSIAWLPSLQEEDVLPKWMKRRVVAECPPVQFHHRSLPAVWDEFVSGLNKSMRDNVKYYPRLMVRHGHDFRFDVAETPEELAASFPILRDLHTQRAEAAATVEHWDYFRPVRRGEFVDRATRRLAAEGHARIGVLRVREEAVAALMWLEAGGTMFPYRTGYLLEWSKYSVVLVALLQAMRNCMDRGIRRVDFLRGGGQLKGRWDTEVRLERHLMLARHPHLLRPLIAARAATHSTTYKVV